MYRVIGARSTGKTYRLLEEASRNNAVVVCENPREMKEKAYLCGFTNIEFMPYQDYIQYYSEKPVYIDDLERFIVVISGRTLSGYTYTIDDQT